MRSALLLPVVSIALSLAEPALAVGEAKNGFPSWNERVALVLTNRARVDPQAELGPGCVATGSCPDAPCFGPAPPLYYNEALNHSSRFHSGHQAKNGYQAHTTPCALLSTMGQWPAVCPDASAACSCVGGALSGGMTTYDARIKLFAVAPWGEVIHSTPKPEKALHEFLNEPSTSAACGQNNGDNGHRFVLLSTTNAGFAGFGADPGITGDFGSTPGESGKIPSGGHFPNAFQGAVELWVNYHDTKAPTAALVNVGGTCSPVTLGRGVAENGAYTTTLMNVGACTGYYFTFKDGDGNPAEYPTTGALQIGNVPEGEDPACPSWTSVRPPAGAGCACTPSCAGKTCGDDGCGGSCGECPDGGASTGSAGPSSTSVTSGGGGAGGAGGAGAGTTGTGGGTGSEAKGCGCRVAGADADARAALALLGAGLAAGRRRRARATRRPVAPRAHRRARPPAEG